MRNSHGFTLLELLLAIVLLAVVVGVVAPYLRVQPDQADIEGQSLFDARVEEVVSSSKVSHNQQLIYEDYLQLAQSRGWDCQRVESNAARSVLQPAFGEWVMLREGDFFALQWARVPQKEERTP